MAYLIALLITASATLINHFAIPSKDHSNMIMIYLLGIVYIASNFGRGPSILASIASVAALDFFCIPPQFTFAVTDTHYLLTVLTMLSIAIIISTLTSQVQEKARLAKEKEQRSSALHSMSRELSVTRGRDQLIAVSLKHIRSYFDAQVAIYISNDQEQLYEIVIEQNKPATLQKSDNDAAQWTYHNRKLTGLGFSPFSQLSSIYLPLIASKGIVGILQVSPRQDEHIISHDEIEILETFANQTAICIEVSNLAEVAQKAALQIEKEQLRNTLLSSISHDLRTPLATITGASSTLLENQQSLDPAKQKELAQIIQEESERLNNLISKLLDMTRLESESLQIHKQWQPLEEIIGAVFSRMEQGLEKRPVKIDLPDNLPLIEIDETLFQHVFQNLIENSIKYTPPTSPIEIKAKTESNNLIIEFSDSGPGIKPGDELRIFSKFYRNSENKTTGGVGLGLAICQAIVVAHGGTIFASNNPQGGASFTIRLPLTNSPPLAPAE